MTARTEIGANGAQSLYGRAVRIFQDDGLFWHFCTVLFGAVALLKGLRFPNTWAATQAQFGYEHGFVKRGLFGALVTQPLHLEHYWRFATVATILLAVLMVALVMFTRWTGMNLRVSPMIATAVFFSSYTLTFLGYINGYFDIPLATIAILLICIQRPMVRLLAGLPLVVIALLTHEMFLLVFLPVVLLTFVLNAAEETELRRSRLVIAAGVVLGMAAVGVTLFIARRPSLSLDQAWALYRELGRRVDFPLQPTFFLVLTRSAGANMRWMLSFLGKASWWADQVGGMVTVLPTMAMLLWLVYRMLEAGRGGRRRWVFAACLVAALAPLSMNAFGFDVGRWWALTGLTTFLAYGAVCRYVRGPVLRFSPAMARVALVIVALNLASGDGLIDVGSTIKAYPYTSEIKSSVKHLLQDRR